MGVGCKAVLGAVAAAALAEPSGTHAAPSVHIMARAPTLVAKTAAAGEYMLFPLSLSVEPRSGHLLLSYQNDEDRLQPAGWTGGLLSSATNGSSWTKVSQPLAPWMVKPCVSRRAGGLLCFEYALRRVDASNTTGLLRGQIFTASATGLRQTTTLNASVTFPADHALSAWGGAESLFMMATDGSSLRLRDGSLFMAMYGNFQLEANPNLKTCVVRG